MKEIYKRSLNELKKLAKRPTRKEWNRIAVEKNLLSCDTLALLSGKSYTTLSKEVRKKVMQ